MKIYCNVCNKYRESEKKLKYDIFNKYIKFFYCLQ